MTEERGGGGGGGESSSSRTTPSYVKSGDRQLFTVELRPGETTFVSWKKLMKDADRNCSGSKPVLDPPPPANAHPNLESRIAPVTGGQQTENEEKDDAPHRFSAVIEKIERLYMGKDSSDDEDLKDAPDDDQYDTEDSFIDDAELDEYFEVDNSAIKHDGFFVNRGKLERIIEPAAVPDKQPKKRRRKDSTKAHGDSENINVSNKHVRIGKSAPGKTMEVDYYEDGKSHNPLNLSGTSTKKMLNGDASASVVEGKDFQMQEPGVLQGNNFTNQSKAASGSSDAYRPKNQIHDKSAYGQNKLPSARPLNNVEEPESSARPKERNGVRMLPDLNNVPDGKISVHTTQATHVHKRDGSSVKPKGSMLEKTIRELEKMVAESRPPAIDNQEADPSQAIKRRLPREIKLKLAKVARLAASQGKMSKDLINRLMNSLGHLIQLRTLKRNLRIMVNTGLSAQQEKDDSFQMIKKEVVEMIKTRVPALESKALEQQAGTSDDFQELNPENKSTKRKFSMDAELEDKICDLYDLFVDGLDEDAGPHVRKLYVELAGLWPIGTMDNHGIKRAICRAKDRRRAVYSRNKDEKIRRKKIMSSSKPEEAVQADPTSAPQHSRERLVSDAAGPVLALASVPLSSPSSIAGLPTNSHSTERPKQDKAKVISGIFIQDAKTESDVLLVKKKAKKRKQEAAELDQSHFRTLHSQSSEERHKSVMPPHSFEQSS
ncbi:UBN1 [Linum grandiflorum]